MTSTQKRHFGAISYDLEVITDPSVLPRHVRQVRETLLDEDFSILVRFKRELLEFEARGGCDNDCGQPCLEQMHQDWFNRVRWNKTLKQRDLTDLEKTDFQEVTDRAKNLSMEARSLVHEQHQEAAWQRYYQKSFIKAIEDRTKVVNDHKSRDARCRFYYDSFKTEEVTQWTVFTRGQNCEKQPHPDIAFFFKVHNDEEPGIAGYKHRWESGIKPRQDVAKNFSRTILRHLAVRHGLQASPFKKFSKEQRHQYKTLCYPWLVMELKINGRKAEEVCDQAANGSRCALQLYANLTKYARKGGPTTERNDGFIPPVIAITGIENETRVWLAYSEYALQAGSGNEEKCHMVCIWVGDMCMSRDALKFELILENAHTWAMRELRGRISAYLDQWLDEHPYEECAEPDPGSEESYVQMDSSRPETPETGGYSTPVETPEELDAGLMPMFLGRIEDLRIGTPSSQRSNELGREHAAPTPSPMSAGTFAGQLRDVFGQSPWASPEQTGWRDDPNTESCGSPRPVAVRGTSSLFRHVESPSFEATATRRGSDRSYPIQEMLRASPSVASAPRTPKRAEGLPSTPPSFQFSSDRGSWKDVEQFEGMSSPAADMPSPTPRVATPVVKIRDSFPGDTPAPEMKHTSPGLLVAGRIQNRPRGHSVAGVSDIPAAAKSGVMSGRRAVSIQLGREKALGVTESVVEVDGSQEEQQDGSLTPPIESFYTKLWQAFPFAGSPGERPSSARSARSWNGGYKF